MFDRHTDTDFGRCCTFNVDETAFADSIFAFNSSSGGKKNSSSIGMPEAVDGENPPQYEPFKQSMAGMAYGVKLLLNLQGCPGFINCAISQVSLIVQLAKINQLCN